MRVCNDCTLRCAMPVKAGGLLDLVEYPAGVVLGSCHQVPEFQTSSISGCCVRRASLEPNLLEVAAGIYEEEPYDIVHMCAGHIHTAFPDIPDKDDVFMAVLAHELGHVLRKNYTINLCNTKLLGYAEAWVLAINPRTCRRFEQCMEEWDAWETARKLLESMRLKCFELVRLRNLGSYYSALAIAVRDLELPKDRNTLIVRGLIKQFPDLVKGVMTYGEGQLSVSRDDGELELALSACDFVGAHYQHQLPHQLPQHVFTD